LHHEDVWWRGAIAPRLLNIGIRCRRVVSFTPGARDPIPGGYDPVSVPMQSVHDGDEKKSRFSGLARGLVSILPDGEKILSFCP
jgi:hypothetical protein